MVYFQFLKRWLIGVIAKVYRPGSQNLVLTIKGAQGKGKSRWLSKLAIAPDIFGEGSVNPEIKDHELRHFNFVIWHASELDGITRKRDQAALKDYFTREDVAVREAYGRFERSGKSVLSFCASVNDDSFLHDQTGNRRFLVLPLANLNSDHTIDMTQLFAQAKCMFDDGQKWWFDNEEVQIINKKNEEFLAQGPVDILASRVKPGSNQGQLGWPAKISLRCLTRLLGIMPLISLNLGS